MIAVGSQTSLLNLTIVIFVIPPVNAKWMKYTGLSCEKYVNRVVQKIRYQLESWRFTNIADFSKDGDQPLLYEDTIHMWMEMVG